jgi:hypothetical protein
MKIEYRMFAVLAVFFAFAGLLYGFWGHWKEPVGVVGLVLATLLAAMIAFYAWFTGKRMGLRPDDDDFGDIDQFEGDFGFFSPYSWWPLFLGASAALCFLGLAVGWWLFIIGASFGVVALIGWTFEYFKGEHAL